MVGDKTTILKGVVGSTAYGLAHEDSDVDHLGVFVRPTSDILGLKKFDESIVTHDPDFTEHEVEKFIKLCLNGNPTVSELLWLEDYEEVHPLGAYLFFARDAFLSQRIRNTYGGYARQQANNLINHGDFGSDLKKRQEKHGRHCTRLLIQGQKALRDGAITVRLHKYEAAICREMGVLAVTDIEAFSAEIEAMFVMFDNTESDLPMEPNWDVANDLLLRIRKEML